MRLLDQVMQCRAPVRVSLPDGDVVDLPGAASLAEAIAETPVRYILSDNVRDACIEIAERWPELLDPISDSLRLPMTALWIEWTESDAAGRSRRAAMLVRAEEGGRSGVVHALWEDPNAGVERAQVHLAFDLEHCLSPGQEHHPALQAFPALRLLAPHARISVEPEWMHYFARARTPKSALGSVVRQCAAQMLPNLPFLMAFIRLLGVRSNVAETVVDRSALNRSRARRGKAPLLDHVEVSLAVGASPDERRSGSCQGRAASRQHVVRGHLVNRRGTIFWRSAHLRGRVSRDGVIKRNVRMKTAPGFRPQRRFLDAGVATD